MFDDFDSELFADDDGYFDLTHYMRSKHLAEMARQAQRVVAVVGEILPSPWRVHDVAFLSPPGEGKRIAVNVFYSNSLDEDCLVCISTERDNIDDAIDCLTVLTMELFST